MDIDKLWEIREKVRLNQPLVVNITNNVVTNFTANVLLAIGAAPIMSEGVAEAEELARIAGAVVLNIGTLHPRQEEYFIQAGIHANKNGVPVVLDPVGVGATRYRNKVAADIMREVKLSLIRGNYGEISFLAGSAGLVKGVDSLGHDIDTGLVKNLAAKTGAVIAATGETDYVTDGSVLFLNNTGHGLLQAVTGTGCALSSLAGAFWTVADDKPSAILAALAFYGAAAQKAAENAAGPGSFAAHFLDSLYNLTKAEFERYIEQKQS